MTTRAQAVPKPGVVASSATAGTSALLQRKCACGAGASSLSGECAECGKKKLGLQTKLRIGESGDVYEQEADRVAEQVLATPAHPDVSSGPPRIQRFSGQSSGQMDAAPASVDRALASSGRPLEPELRHDMEQRFGHDFSRVRVHSGTAAEQSARDVNAHAYTTAHNIVFGAGSFRPGTQEGLRLLAHELTHVVQQSGRHAQHIQRWGFSSFGRAPTPQAPEVPLEDTLDAIAGEYIFIGIKQRDGVEDIKDAAKASKEPSSMLKDVLAFAAEVALLAVSAGVGSIIAQAVERKVAAALAAKARGNISEGAGEQLGKITGETTQRTVSAAKVVADVMKENAKDLAKKGGKAAITKLVESGKTPLEAYFDGQRDFYTDQAQQLKTKFTTERKQQIRYAADPKLEATSMLEALGEQYGNAKAKAEDETLKGWLSYLPKSNLGTEEERGVTTTKHGEHSDLFTLIQEPKVKGLLYLFTDQSADANIETAQLAGADAGLRNPLKGRTLRELKIPFVMKSKERYEIIVNEEGIGDWDETRTNFTWLSQFAISKKIGKGAVTQMAAEGAHRLIQKIMDRRLPEVTD